jgi:hypothetical protein
VIPNEKIGDFFFMDADDEEKEFGHDPTGAVRFSMANNLEKEKGKDKVKSNFLIHNRVISISRFKTSK